MRSNNKFNFRYSKKIDTLSCLWDQAVLEIKLEKESRYIFWRALANYRLEFSSNQDYQQQNSTCQIKLSN